MHKPPRTINARQEALQNAHDVVSTCGLDVASEILRGQLLGYAEAYLIVDPNGFHEIIQALAGARPPRGMKPVCVVDNAHPNTAANALGAA